MQTMKCCAALALGLVLSFPAAPLRAETLTPEKRQEVLRLVEALGGNEMIDQCVRQNMELVKKLRPDIPADKMPVVEREIAALLREKIAAPGGLAEQVMPVFSKRFTEAELRQLAAFYESPVGRKAVAVLPQALREARDVAQRTAIGFIPEISQRVTDTLRREAGNGASGRGEAAVSGLRGTI